MPSTNHSHACKKFVPQRALAYTLSETYVGREKIVPYLQILYYISYLAKNSYKNGSKYTKFTKNKIIFNIIFILYSYVFYALFKKYDQHFSKIAPEKYARLRAHIHSMHILYSSGFRHYNFSVSLK